ncbi:L-arabinose-binding protein [Orenia metallireducens]|jgi:arabinosaccharide transport system substrate-binding protein|uniref:L-arabinose-binding protein n=1 Tax=Orenia metallireducens TaxID=1413210 RepID=A0A285H392_9FIRM|nr:sugar ABC transporter substrate-binding protein [Orenia metallireducens]PRX29505.1 L-arabinose-binding protein [Orenia metallireducens]SNY30299.1 L-arabinose-binding protein [Orenia metallireducens]
MKRKLLILCLICTLVISVSFILSGCSAGNKEGSKESASSDSAVELEMWTFVNAHADYYKKKAKEFNDLHPEFDFKLKTQTYPYDQMHDKLNIALQTGIGGPDISDIEIGKFPGIVANNKEGLVDLTSTVDKYRDEIVEARVTPYSSNGRVYGIPTHLGTGVMYYNKELFEKAGVSPESIKTWEDFIKVGKKLTKDTNGDGKIDQWMTGVPTSDFMTFNVMSNQLGSNVFDKDENIILNRPENVKVLKYMQDLVHKYKIANPIPLYDDQNVYRDLNDGKYAAVLAMPQWYMIRFTEFMPDLEGKVLVRGLPSWGNEGTRSSTGGGTGTAIMATTEHQEIAKEFLEYAKLTKEAGVEMWTELGFDPIRKDAYDNPKLYEPIPFFNNEKVMETISELQSEIQPLYLSGLYAKARDIINQEVLFNAIENNKDPKKLLDEATKELKEEKAK